MKIYEVTYFKNGIYQSTIVEAQSEESARDFIETYKYVDCISCNEKAEIDNGEITPEEIYITQRKTTLLRHKDEYANGGK